MKKGNPGNSGKKPLFTTWPRDQTALIPRPRGEKGYFVSYGATRQMTKK